MNTINTDCPFCKLSNTNDIVFHNNTFVLRYDHYPITDGHLLLIPVRHIESFTELNVDELLDFYEILKYAKQHVIDLYDPDGFNVGINEGYAAGQTINHLHIHLIPRYLGDVMNPTGGVRNLIPEKAVYPQKV